MIKIDIEMPESCAECEFCRNIRGDYECFANSDGNVMYDTTKKPEWCPLIEVKE